MCFPKIDGLSCECFPQYLDTYVYWFSIDAKNLLIVRLYHDISIAGTTNISSGQLFYDYSIYTNTDEDEEFINKLSQKYIQQIGGIEYDGSRSIATIQRDDFFIGNKLYTPSSPENSEFYTVLTLKTDLPSGTTEFKNVTTVSTIPIANTATVQAKTGFLGNIRNIGNIFGPSKVKPSKNF